MTDNITESEERIIQLLAALNSTLGSYTASQESDTSDNVANQLSSTALVVSLIALIVALLQAVLQYVSSNSAQGDKCNAGAIGEFARVFHTTGWSWRHWRRQYFYPELELNPMGLWFYHQRPARSAVGNVFEGLENLVPMRLDSYKQIKLVNHEQKECYSWRYHPGLESFARGDFIRNGRYYLFRRAGTDWDIVLPRDLPLKYRLKWFYYCASHGRTKENTPRATWAQLLRSLNADPDQMKLHVRHLVDANCIPSSLDVPTQKVELTDLGYFAFFLGFRNVKIDKEAREIMATGDIGTITTESMPGFGAVVRLQVSSPRPQHVVVGFSLNDVFFYRRQLLGSFIFNGISWSRTLQYSSLRRKLVKAGAVVDARGPTIADEVNWWLETAKDCKHERSEASEIDLCLECMAVWQPLAGGRSWPTILLAASGSSIPRFTTGFPSTVFLSPFLPVFQLLAHSLSARRGAICSQDILGNLQEGTMVLDLLQHDLCRVTGHEYLTWGQISQDEHFSWMNDTCGLGDVELIESILLSRMGTRASYTHFKKGKDWVWTLRMTGTKFQLYTEAPNTSDPVNAKSLTEGRLMPYIVDLLDDFDPISWATVMRRQSISKYNWPQMNVSDGDKGGWRTHMQPHNVLWTQTFLLDLAITKSCYQHTISIEAVSGALVESWEEAWDPTSKTTAPLQNLHQFLYRKTFKDHTSEEIPQEARKLADMIKTRMLCYIAYMMVIPDSTSVYKASLEDPVVLPMI